MLLFLFEWLPIFEPNILTDWNIFNPRLSAVFARFQVADEVFHVDWSSCQKLIHFTHDTFVQPNIDHAPRLIDKRKSILDTDDQSAKL